MRATILVATLWWTTGWASAEPGNNFFYYEMVLREDLTTELIIRTVANYTQLDEIERCSSIEVSSPTRSERYLFKMQPVRKPSGLPWASALLPFSKDWMVTKCIGVPDLNIQSEPNEIHYSFYFPNVGVYGENYLGQPSENERSLRGHVECMSGKVEVMVEDLSASKEYAFILLVDKTGRKFVDQYFGPYRTPVQLRCLNVKSGFLLARKFSQKDLATP